MMKTGSLIIAYRGNVRFGSKRTLCKVTTMNPDRFPLLRGKLHRYYLSTFSSASSV
jgi:hypothetical protein